MAGLVHVANPDPAGFHPWFGLRLHKIIQSKNMHSFLIPAYQTDAKQIAYLRFQQDNLPILWSTNVHTNSRVLFVPHPLPGENGFIIKIPPQYFLRSGPRELKTVVNWSAQVRWNIDQLFYVSQLPAGSDNLVHDHFACNKRRCELASYFIFIFIFIFLQRESILIFFLRSQRKSISIRSDLHFTFCAKATCASCTLCMINT